MAKGNILYKYFVMQKMSQHIGWVEDYFILRCLILLVGHPFPSIPHSMQPSPLGLRTWRGREGRPHIPPSPPPPLFLAFD